MHIIPVENKTISVTIISDINSNNNTHKHLKLTFKGISMIYHAQLKYKDFTILMSRIKVKCPFPHDKL